MDPCFTPPTFRYVVFPRLATVAQEAQRLAARAVARVSALSSPPRAGDPVEDALAHALFLLAEPRFEAALGLRLWRDLDPNEVPSTAQLLAWINRRFRRTQGSRLSLGGLPERPLYERVLAHSDSPWSAAARSRMSQLLLDLNDQLFHIPAPMPTPPRASGIAPATWKAIFKDVICEPADELRAADESLSACYVESARRLLDDPYARFCREALSLRHPAELNEAHEIYIQPNLEIRVSLSIAGALKLPA